MRVNLPIAKAVWGVVAVLWVMGVFSLIRPSSSSRLLRHSEKRSTSVTVTKGCGLKRFSPARPLWEAYAGGVLENRDELATDNASCRIGFAAAVVEVDPFTVLAWESTDSASPTEVLVLKEGNVRLVSGEITIIREPLQAVPLVMPHRTHTSFLRRHSRR